MTMHSMFSADVHTKYHNVVSSYCTLLVAGLPTNQLSPITLNHTDIKLYSSHSSTV